MKRPAMQLTIREWRTSMSRREPWIAMIAVAGILAVAGPFESSRLLPFLPRALYWAAIVTSCYSAGFLTSAFIEISAQHLPRWVRLVLASAAVGLVVSVIVCALNYAVFRYVPRGADLIQLLGAIFAIAAIVTVTMDVLFASRRTQQNEPDQGPAILDRLPHAKRGRLLALSADDHYTRVITTKGSEMVLMRLGDAIREVGNTPGAQVHRSHWVAWAAVSASARDGDRLTLTLTTGDTVPVSRANRSRVKEAGLL